MKRCGAFTLGKSARPIFAYLFVAYVGVVSQQSGLRFSVRSFGCALFIYWEEDMKKQMMLAIMAVVILITLSACACKHEWTDATCTTAKTCTLCGATEGEPLGHTWNAATCTTPKTCSVCGVKEGEALGHTWIEATCASPRTCSACGTTVGSTLEHSFGDWQTETEATVLEDGKRVRYCESCGKSDEEAYQMDSYIQDGKFVFTPKEFGKLFFKHYNDLGYAKFGGTRIEEKEGQVIVDIRDVTYSNVGNIGFVVDSSTWTMASSDTDSGFEGIIMIISANEEFVANAMISVIMSCNPTITEYGARKVADSALLEEQATYKGVTYTFAITGNYYTMTAVVDG